MNRKIRSRFKLLHGVGINDADYFVTRSEVIDGKQVKTWKCPFYVKWSGMLGRCYSVKFLKRSPNYHDCEICADWIYFTKFKAWMETQNWEGKELDKDLLVRGNKTYSPETCVFIDKRVNLFLIDSAAARGEWPIGVHFCKRSKKYKAGCCDAITGKTTGLGYYKTPEEAHKAWLAFKLKQAYILAEQQTDGRVAKALIDRYENYGNHTKAA